MHSRHHSHPFAGYNQQMGSFLDDIWSDVSKAAETQAKAIVTSAPKQIASAVATSVASNADVKKAATATANQAAINATAQQLADAQKKLAAGFAAFKANPILWVKNNPGKTAMFAGIGVTTIAGIFFLMRGMTK